MNADEVEAVAQRVAELLAERSPSPAGLIDAAAAARLLGVSRATIYARANELGAVRLGHGPRARLRFDPRRLEASLSVASAPGPRPAPVVTPQRRRRPSRPGAAELLPIRGQAPQ